MATTQMQRVIDFSKFGGPVFTGRDRGALVRKKMEIDAFDETTGTVKVFIPDDTYSVTSSFFLGLFGESIRRAGNRDTFLEKFHFDSPKVFQATFESCIARALQEQTALVED